MLGADIHEYGETYEQIEPRLFGYMHHRLPSGGIGNSYLSETGFLGTDKDGNKDSLRGTIEQDADYLRDRGLTSHALGAPLHAIRDYFFERSFAARPLSFDITINGTPYHVRYLSGPSGQSCPFIDSTDNRQPDLLIENMETHETLFFAGILAHIISEHTFFEGEHAGQYGGEPSVSYRIPPEKLIAFFNIPTQDKSEF